VSRINSGLDATSENRAQQHSPLAERSRNSAPTDLAVLSTHSGFSGPLQVSTTAEIQTFDFGFDAQLISVPTAGKGEAVFRHATITRIRSISLSGGPFDAIEIPSNIPSRK
jgi:hypothetical protein